MWLKVLTSRDLVLARMPTPDVQLDGVRVVVAISLQDCRIAPTDVLRTSVHRYLTVVKGRLSCQHVCFLTG
jgi:hypothetical protein